MALEHLFIINPVAGGGKPLKLIPHIKNMIQAKGEAYEIILTQKPGHASEIASDYARRGTLRIYSCGGDDTLNEIVNGMAGSSSSLAILPGGSGNDFIRTICKNPYTDDILERTVNGREVPMDLASVNGRYFLNISSVGFDAQVAWQTNIRKKFYGTRGKLAYLVSVFETILKYRNYPLRVNIDGTVVEQMSLMAAIANGKYYGGGMKPAPEAEIDDGILDLCLIDGIDKLKIVRFLPKFMKGRHTELKWVHFFKGKRIEIQCPQEIFLNMDGEVVKTREAVFTILPGGIRVVLPE